MARRSFIDRAREFIAGASRRVRDTISDFFERSNDPIESEELTTIIDFDLGSQDENQSSGNEILDADPDELAEAIDRADPPTEMFPPEGFPSDEDNPDEEFESEFNFEFGRFGDYSPKDLRRILSSFEEAVEYARDITLPPEDITIVQDTLTQLFRVLVEYEVVTTE